MFLLNNKNKVNVIIYFLTYYRKLNNLQKRTLQTFTNVNYNMFNYIQLMFPKYFGNIFYKKFNMFNVSKVIRITVLNKYINHLLYVLKKHTNLQLNLLVDIIAYDLLLVKLRFKLIYFLRSLHFNNSMEILLYNNNSLPFFSVTSIYKSAYWIECEIWDMFGIFFINNKQLVRLLTDYGFKGYPLRKDFPLTGYKELKYSLHKKILYYVPVELMQEYRVFTFNRK